MPPRARSGDNNSDSTETTETTDGNGSVATGKSEKDSGKDSGTAYLNTSGGPLVYDREGHMIGAGEWTPEINLDLIGRQARQAGFLLPRSAL